MMLDEIDVALLMSEHGGRYYHCPCCKRAGIDGHDVFHADNCAMNLALSMRGFPTQKERDAARAGIRAAVSTVPPPPKVPTDDNV
jgi:hypothetical protein